MALEKFQTVTLNSIDEILALDNNVRRSISK
jgi:hypothetical protein